MATLLFFLLTVIFMTVAAAQNFQEIALDLHHIYRTKHHVDPLISSDDLINRATKCAQYYAARGTIDHSCPYKNGAGENLWLSAAAQDAGSFPVISDEDVARNSTNAWYSEESQHNYNGDWQPASGHFSQIVWRSSREFGFGTGQSRNLIVGCALYEPHGNVLGQFWNNVFRP